MPSRISIVLTSLTAFSVPFLREGKKMRKPLLMTLESITQDDLGALILWSCACETAWGIISKNGVLLRKRIKGGMYCFFQHTPLYCTFVCQPSSAFVCIYFFLAIYSKYTALSRFFFLEAVDLSHKHCISKTEKTVPLFDCLPVGPQHIFSCLLYTSNLYGSPLRCGG